MCSQMVSLISFPSDFCVAFTISTTIGLQPPQPVVALVSFTTSDKVVAVPSIREQQRVPLVTFSQEQITAVSGRSVTLPNVDPYPPREPRIKSSGFAGKAIALA